MQTASKLNVVVIGGGHGTSTLLRQLKRTFENLTAIVNMADDGGSSGTLRRELGVLPPGDVRQCLIALSDWPMLGELFDYRFDQGGLKGHSFGNLFLSAAEKKTGNFAEAVALASEALRVRGKVLPVSTTDTQLVLTQADGAVVRGEYRIGHYELTGQTRPPIVKLDPPAQLCAEVGQAIEAADLVVIAPGNLYGSLAPTLLVDGMRVALTKTTAKVVYVCNLVSTLQQTEGFTVSDFASEIERFIGAPVLNYVLFNTTQLAPNLLSAYTHVGEQLLTYDTTVLEAAHYQAIGLPLIAAEMTTHNAADAIAHARSLIRHDAVAVAQALLDIGGHEVA